MIEIAGLVLSGVSFAKDLYKEYKDFNTWPLSDLSVDGEWLPLAIEKGLLEAVLPDNSYSLIFLTFFRRGVNLKSLVIGTAKENPES